MEEKKKRKRIPGLPICSGSNYSQSRFFYRKKLEENHRLHKEYFEQISATITVEIKNIEILPKKAFVKCFGSIMEITLTKAKELEDTGIPVIYKY